MADKSGSNPNPGEAPFSVSPSLSEKRRDARPQILIVEDNAADAFLIRRAIEEAKLQADLHFVPDGEQAIRFFDENTHPCPSLVILDINLPRRGGGEVLAHLRKTRKCGRVVVIVVSTSSSKEDRENMATLGANGYFRKPSEYADFMKLGDLVRKLLT